MTISPDILIDRIFFGFGAFVFVLFALRPVAFLRLITLGKFRQGDVPESALRALRVVVAVTAICVAMSRSAFFEAGWCEQAI